MTKNEKEITRDFLIPWTNCFVFCFSQESTKQWKERFMNQRLERFLEDNTDLFETATGIELNEKNLKDFKLIYCEMFMQYVEEYLAVLKKTRDEETREKIKREGVARKVDSSEGKVKRKRK